MRKIILNVLILLFITVEVIAFPLAKNGTTNYVIASGDKTIPAENTAAQELARYLKQQTGATFAVVPEAQIPAGKQVVYVGWTKFAEKQGIDFSKLGQDEWIIRTTPSHDLILTGGRTRGTLYAVFDFLEKQGGCRWLDPEQEIVPERKDFELPELNIRKTPAFRIRMIWDSTDWYPESYHFKTKNKTIGYADAAWGWGYHYGRPGQHHTLYLYSNKFPQGTGNWLTLDEHGKRLHPVNGEGPGHICFMNPEARKFVLGELKQFIAQDRTEAREKGYAFPVIYDISQNDSQIVCHCPACRKMVQQEGSESAPLIDFINEIAREIRKDYPEVQIRTFAYIWSLEPPKNLKIEDNVLIHLAFQLRPLGTPDNSATIKRIQSWAKLAHLGIWDYWTSTDYDPTPFSIISSLTEDIRLCAQNNVTDMFIESENVPFSNFFALREYLGMKLMEDPNVNAKQIVTEFNENYYGKAAAPYMNELIRYLEKRQTEEKAQLGHDLSNWEHLDREFFERSFQLLNQAEKAASGNQTHVANIRRERIPFLCALLLRRPFLSNAEKAFNFDACYREFKTLVFEVLDYYHRNLPPENFHRVYTEKLQKLLQKLRQNNSKVSIPKFLDGRKVIILAWPRFRTSGKGCIVDDKDSAQGKAFVLTSPDRKYGKFDTPFGVYDQQAKKTILIHDVKSSQIPDEKYHLYNLGTLLSDHAEVYFWGCAAWEFQCSLYNYLQPGVKYDVFVSAKFTGKDYHPDSTSTNGIFVDYILLAAK